MKAVAIIVSYQPAAQIRELIEKLAPQVWRVCIVDNGSGPAHTSQLECLAKDEVHLIELGRNYGIGYAHNRGIEWARREGATHVLLLDQDSVPEHGMLARLANAERVLLQQRVRVGALGPTYRELHSGNTWPFYRLTRFGIRGQRCATGGSSIVPCDFLISSGTFVSLSTLDDIGGMNEGYFLEHVDTEWSLRALSLGYRLFGVCDARMQHSLGTAAMKVPWSRRKVQIYPPERHYYLFRNALLLAREKHALLPWKLHEARRLLLRLLYFGTMVPPRGTRLRMMMRGIRDGLRGISGPYAA